MIEYPKINSLWKRDKKGKFIVGEYSCPEFEYLKDLQWIGTEKVDGTNMRVHFQDGNYEIAGRTDKAQVPPKLIASIEAMFNEKKDAIVEQMEERSLNSITFFGEGYGAGIQSGGIYRADMSFICFDVLIDDKHWIDAGTVCSTYEIPYVSLKWAAFDLNKWETRVKEGIPSALTMKMDTIAEGVVLRPAVRLYDESGNPITVKMKHRDYK